MILIPLGVVWSGYLLVWYGICTLKDNGVGIVDLIKPSSIATVQAALSGGNSGPIQVPDSSGTGPGLTDPATGQYKGPRAPDGTPLIPPGTPVA